MGVVGLPFTNDKSVNMVGVPKQTESVKLKLIVGRGLTVICVRKVSDTQPSAVLTTNFIFFIPGVEYVVKTNCDVDVSPLLSKSQYQLFIVPTVTCDVSTNCTGEF